MSDLCVVLVNSVTAVSSNSNTVSVCSPDQNPATSKTFD